MKLFACYLLCSMLSGVSEVLFLAAKDFINGRYGRTARRLPDSSAHTRTRMPSVPDRVITNGPDAAGLESEQA
jgi:hypothetical protein